MAWHDMARHGTARGAHWPSPAAFQFDGLLEEGASQQHAYELAARPLVSELLRGGDAALLALGQSGAGKTYSLFGSEAVLSRLSSAPAEARHRSPSPSPSPASPCAC